MNRDEYYMKMAFSLAKKGSGKTSPNPLVGAVLVKNGKVLSKGYHKRAGLPHAEVEALRSAGDKAKDATLYVNLEPCNHFGKTPPCTDMIIKRGIKRVVIGMRDPNPLNNGKGIERLRRSGIDVRCGVLEEESKALNRVFKTYIMEKRPYVTIKVAQSLDGKIATSSGRSKWITNESSRRFVHRLRSRADAVLVGVNTVIKDNPRLNSRMKNIKRQPIRVILDSRLRVSKDSNIIKERSLKTIVATTKAAPKKKIIEFQKMGIDVVCFKDNKGMVDIKPLLKYLARKDISHLLVEGGGTVIASFLKDKLADEIFIFIAPKIIGGKDTITSVEGKGVKFVDEALKLKKIGLRRLGKDILIQGNVYRDN